MTWKSEWISMHRSSLAPKVSSECPWKWLKITYTLQRLASRFCFCWSNPLSDVQVFMEALCHGMTENSLAWSILVKHFFFHFVFAKTHEKWTDSKNCSRVGCFKSPLKRMEKERKTGKICIAHNCARSGRTHFTRIQRILVFQKCFVI